MKTIERRINALEIKTSAVDESLKLVCMEAGETEADALKRVGFSSDALDVMRVMFISPTDARL